MKVDLLSVTDEPLPFNFRVDPAAIDLETQGVQVTGDITVSGEISRNAAKTDVHGSINVPVEIECTRCLTLVKQELDVVFQVDFVGKELFADSKETHLENSDLDTDIIEGNELDLIDVVREQILLNLPET